jgi:hypothetical protein
VTIARVTAHDGVGTTSATFGGTPTAGRLLLCGVSQIASSSPPTVSGWTPITSETWQVKFHAGMSNGEGRTSHRGKTIHLSKHPTLGVVLHEVAHALDPRPPTVDGHWGHHADLMHNLFDEYTPWRAKR